MATFPGYSRNTLQFLADLTHHNDKSWFDAHRDDYQRHLVEPSLALILDLDEVTRSISPHYRGIPKKLGGSLMRIYRDVRFSKDKTPYKTNIGIQIRHQGGADVHGPGWYVHFQLGEAFVGAGCWHPEPEDLKKIRQSVAARPGAYLEALEAARQAGLVPAGTSAVRVPAGFDADHPHLAEIKRKDFLVSEDLDPDLYLGPGLVPALEAKIRASAPYMAWLCRSLGVPF